MYVQYGKLRSPGLTQAGGASILHTAPGLETLNVSGATTRTMPAGGEGNDKSEKSFKKQIYRVLFHSSLVVVVVFLFLQLE
jgi:hypothetical protein